MSAAEVGGYIRCLAHTWEDGPVPFDAAKRARIIGEPDSYSAAIWSVISCKFFETSEGFLNARLEEIRKEMRTFSRGQREKATVKSSTDKRLRANRPQSQTVAKSEPEQSQIAAKATAKSDLSDLRSPISTDQEDLICTPQAAPAATIAELEAAIRAWPKDVKTSPSRQLVSLWKLRSLEKLGLEPSFATGKDPALLVAQWRQRRNTDPDVVRMIEAFFESDNAFIREAGYSVGVFVSQMNKLLVAESENRGMIGPATVTGGRDTLGVRNAKALVDYLQHKGIQPERPTRPLRAISGGER